VAIEALYGRCPDVARPWRWPLAANAASLGIGFLIFEGLARLATGS